MKRIFFVLAILFFFRIQAAAGSGDIKYVEATDLTMLGKMFDDIPHPYHRVDTARFREFTAKENMLLRFSTGLAVAFKTDSPTIHVWSEFGEIGDQSCTTGISMRGYDLYIRRDGKWLYADSKSGAEGDITLISDMDGDMKECIIYFPMYSEILSCKIGVPEGAVLEALPSPFKYRVGLFGSSFMHGVSTSRSGMVLPNQFTRHTGVQILSLACSGNCLLQPYFADVLNAADVDALLFDTFSNPSADLIEERLFPFIERIQEVHPDIPLIFMQTIVRGRTHFNLAIAAKEQAKRDTAERLMREACKKYKNVYFIEPTADDRDFETSVDGTHPDGHGYQIWSESIEKPVLKILRKYKPFRD